jgi:hypothetical protein
MKIRLDGRDNIIDQAYGDLSVFDKSKGGLSEEEKQKIIKKINDQVTYDYYNTPVLKIKRTQETDYGVESMDMQKAKELTKLIKKTIINKKGQQQTVYVKPEGSKTEWLNKFMNFFSFKSPQQVSQRLEQDYKKNQLDKKGVTWQQWKDHVSEYFSNKDKWDRFFSGKPSEKKEQEKKAEAQAKKSEKKPKTSVYKLSLMKFIAGMYGNIPEKKEEPVKPVEKPIENKPVENNFETMPEKEKEVTGSQKGMKGKEIAKEEFDSYLYTEKQIKETENNLRDYAHDPEGEKYQMYEKRLEALDKELENQVKAATQSYGITFDEFISRLNKYDEDKKKLAVKEDENVSPKEKDKKIAQKINKVTPENRNETEREIVGIPEPPAEIIPPKVEFKPVPSNIKIPFYKGGNPQMVQAFDYTGAVPKDIYLVREKTILTEARPSYIPEVDENFFKSERNFIPIVKLGEDKYLIQIDKEKRVYRDGWVNEGRDYYAIVNRDVLASTLDYYLKKAKMQMKAENEELKQKTGYSRLKGRSVRTMPENKMSYPQMNFIQSFIGPSSQSAWKMYREIRQDLKQKTEDMEIQLEDYYNTHAKGRETAYGDKGTKDTLLKDYGVKVKRQNGAEISAEEIDEIKNALTDVYSAFGDRSSMAKNFGLKISHAGETRMHARKAVGLFLPSMKAIGVSAKYGDKGTGFILAHEWGHFMDFYVGDKNGRHYISDNPEHVAGKIADTFRKNMRSSQKSMYQTRTCECFARAMEQYWAIKTGNKELLNEWDSIGNHPTEPVFMEKVMPLIDQFITENEQLLKAFNKGFDNNIKVFIKRINPLTGEPEYRKVK